jgi:hypothetical protein
MMMKEKDRSFDDVITDIQMPSTIYVYTYICTYVRMYVCMYVYIYMYIYIYASPIFVKIKAHRSGLMMMMMFI